MSEGRSTVNPEMSKQTVVFRAMREGEDGMPDKASNQLGIRRGYDIPVADDGTVVPGTGGMSVNPDDPLYLPQSFRPKSLGGTGSNPVWAIEVAAFLETLAVRGTERKGFVEPREALDVEQYEEDIAASGPHWEKRYE